MNYKKNHAGLWVPDEIRAKGLYHVEHMRDGELIDAFDCENIVVNEGLIAMLNIMFAGVGAIGAWYMGLFQNNYTPVNSDTASSFISNGGEFTSYSGGARPTFTPAAASGSPSLSNTASKATFNITGGATLMGAFVISSATPGSNSGTLYSAVQFGSSKSVSNGDSITLAYTTTLTGS